MRSIDYAIYYVHTLFWTSFGVTRVVLRVRERRRAPPVVEETHTAPYSRAVLAFHAVAFAVMYIGLGYAIGTNRVPAWFPGQRLAGTLIVCSGAALMVWALVSFQSWRFRAALDADHELATGGPFRILRHPIYMALNLLALGSAVWVPSAIVWASVVLMVIGGDLRARAEEIVLEQAFGTRYRDYCARTRRFIPGLY